MMTPSDKPKGGSFSSFGIGVAFGIAAAFLFGTEEGRKIVKKVIDSLPETPLNSNNTDSSLRGTPRQSMPDFPVEETQHHATYPLESHWTQTNEAPPPPEPHIRPMRPEPFIR